MKAVLSMAWPVLTFRAGPEDLPYAPRALPLLVIFNLLVSYTAQQLNESAQAQPVLQLSMMALMCEAAWLSFCLRQRQWLNRWVQSMSALVLVDTAISLLALPLAGLLALGGWATSLVVVLQLVLTLWSINARGAIYMHALSVARWRGILLGLVPMLMVILITLTLFPQWLPIGEALDASSTGQ